MNGVTSVPGIGFGLSHRVTVARDSRDDRDSCAVKAQMRQTNSAEKLMPFLSGVFWKIDELVPLLLLRPAHERYEVGVERGGMDATALRSKADRAALQIDVSQWNSGFGDSTTLSHRNEPRILHPRRLFLKGGFDLALLVGRDFGLLLRWRPFVPKLKTWIGVDVITSDCFLQNRRENFEFCESSIEFSRSDNIAGWVSAELGIGSADLVRYLKRRDHIDVIQIRGHRGPCVSVSRQRFRIRILISKEPRNPNVEPIALSVSIGVQFAHCMLCGYLFDLSKRAVGVNSNFGTLVRPGGIRPLISNPVERACVSLLIRCHALQHSAAKQNPSMTISRGK
jgi:hypothetical protein